MRHCSCECRKSPKILQTIVAIIILVSTLLGALRYPIHKIDKATELLKEKSNQIDDLKRAIDDLDYKSKRLQKVSELHRKQIDILHEKKTKKPTTTHKKKVNNLDKDYNIDDIITPTTVTGTLLILGRAIFKVPIPVIP